MSGNSARTWAIVFLVPFLAGVVRTSEAQDVVVELGTLRQGDQKVSGFISPPERAPRTQPGGFVIVAIK